jgi:ferrous iron transport protein A
MNSSQTAIPLSHLKSGHRGRIVAIKASRPLLQRLLSLGFTRGCQVQVVKRAPLGDPIQFKLRGSAVSLRNLEAAQVLVEIS